MMTRKFLGIGALLFAASLYSFQAQDPSAAGEWELVAATQKGEVTWKVVFTQTGESFDVSMTGPRGHEVMGKGTLKGDAIEWSIRVNSPRGEMDIVYKGTVAGDTMAGEVTRGNMGTSQWSAKRKTTAP